MRFLATLTDRFIAATTWLMRSWLAPFRWLAVIIHELGHALSYWWFAHRLPDGCGWIAIGVGCLSVPGDETGRPLKRWTWGRQVGNGVCCYQRVHRLTETQHRWVLAAGSISQLISLVAMVPIIFAFIEIGIGRTHTFVAILTTVLFIISLEGWLLVNLYMFMINLFSSNNPASDGAKIRTINHHRREFRERNEIGSLWKFGYRHHGQSRVLYLGPTELVYRSRPRLGWGHCYRVDRQTRGVAYIFPADRRRAELRRQAVIAQSSERNNRQLIAVS